MYGLSNGVITLCGVEGQFCCFKPL